MKADQIDKCMKQIYLLLLFSVLAITPQSSFGFKENPFLKPVLKSKLEVKKVTRKNRQKEKKPYDFKDISLKGIFYINDNHRKALIKIKDKLHEMSVNDVASDIKVLQISRFSVIIGHGKSRKTLTLASERILDAQ